LKQLGLEGKCQVYDMWSGEDLGEAEEAIDRPDYIIFPFQPTFFWSQ